MTSKGLLTIALAVLVFSVLPASAAMVSISGSPFSVDPGGTAFGLLNASGVTNLGSATVNLTYNPSVVIVTGVSAGSGNALNVPAFNINNVNGVVQIIANSAGGKGGNVIIANITFQAAGSAGRSSPLNITIREFIDTGFNPITASPTNGSFTITGTPTPTIVGNITYSNNGTGIPSVTVNLTNASGVIAITTTNASGNYSFTNVIPGNYNVNTSKPMFFGNSTGSVVVIAGSRSTVNQILWLKGDLNNNGISADAGDLVLMKRAAIGEISADFRYDLNNNGILADAGDLVLMKRAAIAEIILS
jgi:hypothetical protein